MEWMNRGGQSSASANQSAGAAAPAPRAGGKKSGSGFMRVASVALLFAAAILIIIMAVYFAVGGGKSSASVGKVDANSMQAVFLNGGQVYFGKVKTVSSQSLQLDNIYYLRVNQQVQPNGQQSTGQDISLVKLGCELHGPQDSMVINQSQVIFWENLKADGQVAKAVDQYIKDNPNGQKCETNTGSSTNTNSTTNATTNTNSTTTTTPKKN